ncbi:MAG: class I SAM-dependent methyltransferase [Candidatus Eremiobacteraeota bacterium]|nr:class I SAM-dependent methyltransferase [Candidatus Eremiobacteraeota bacterium]
MSIWESDYQYLIDDLDIDTADHWTDWDWKKVMPMISYEFARLEEYRDRIIVAFRLYNLIGLEHLRRELGGVSKNARILDAGGGTGRKAIPLAREGFNNITVLDHAEGWLRLAEEKAESAGVSDRLKIVKGDILDMSDFPDNSFDHVFSMGGAVVYCGNPGRALKEMARILKPGGKMIADGIHNTLGAMHLFAINGDLESLEKAAVNNSQHSGIVSMLPEELEKDASAAGFCNIRVLSECIFTPDDSIRTGTDTKRWEQIVIDLEMKHCNDPRFLGAGGLMVTGERE